MKRRTLFKLSGLSALGLLVGCTPNEIKRAQTIGLAIKKGDVNEVLDPHLPSTGIAEVDRLIRNQLENLAEQLYKKWGDKKVASPKEYVKYTDEYQSRALINFETGVIQVETLTAKQSQDALEQAIVTTLLTPDDPSEVDLLSDKAIQPTSEPFLHNLVLDHQGQAIRYQWRAQQYAKHLLRTAYNTRKEDNKTIHFVQFDMVKTHQAESQHKYADDVRQYSRQFRVKTDLIYAIMEAESSFSPYAMSHIPAYGLMQIVPSSAGRDAHQKIYNKPGTPSKDYLFVANNNIQMGTAYLSILNDRYLARVSHPLSREYCVIAGYNTGSGNVLKAFDSDRNKAFDRINAMRPAQVYSHLVKNLPYQETRRYMQKVTEFQKKYV
jgi:membrane-bound lytic murein transglycosylase C